MDLELLKTFIEVGHTRHFGRAADNLFLTQSAVSARIRLLESQLDCQLFQRNTKQVYLTPEGEKFVIHAQRILDTWAAAKQDIASDPPADQGLHISSHHNLWHFLFNDRLASLPLPLSLSSLPLAEAWQALENHQTDLLLTYKASHHAGFTQQILGQLPLVPVISKAHYDSFQWQKTAYIHIDWGIAFEQFRQRHLTGKLPCIAQTDHAASAIPLLMQHPACCWLPPDVIRHYPALSIILLPDIPDFRQSLCALYASHSNRKQRIQTMLEKLSF